MFPYKIRKPAWGSCKSKSIPRSDDDAISRLGGDPDDCHAIGGNLQRAILLDMLALRERYRDVEASARAQSRSASAASAAASARSSSSSRLAQKHDNSQGRRRTQPQQQQQQQQHAALGTSFARFKACFGQARFGAIHTRAIPPRVDRGEYVQLLYSCCFHLLERSFEQHGGGGGGGSNTAGGPLNWEEDDDDDDNNSQSQRPDNVALNAVYAAFLLHALHRTNVLPAAPPPRSRTERTSSGRPDERSLREAWSVLPIGNTSDEDKLYRRVFRTGVRVDRRNYLLLLRLRDGCLSRADRCRFAEMERRSTNGYGETAAASERCRCGMARDAAHVIDEMLFGDASFFEYCEYHGPHCLEGLAGSANFYKACFFVKPPEKSKRSRRNAAPAVVAALEVPSPLSESKLNAMQSGNPMDDPLDMQSLSGMVASHRSNLSSVMGQLQKSRGPGGSMQPKQRELVENTLGNMLDSSNGHLQMLDKLKGKKDSNAIVLDKPSVKLEVKPPPEIQQTDDTGMHGLLSFPESFSSALCERIGFSLSDFKDEAKTMRNASVAKDDDVGWKDDWAQHDVDIHPDLACFDDLDPAITQQKSLPCKIPTGNDKLPATADKPRRSKPQRKLKTESLDNNKPTNASEKEDEVSVATGAGKNALLSLLSMAEGNNDDVKPPAKADMPRRRSKRRTRSMTKSLGENLPIDAPEKGDEVSVATGAGKNALLSLLSMTEGNNDDENNAFDEHDEVSMATGVGRKSLLSLLSMAEGNVKSEPLEDESVASEDGQSELLSLVPGMNDDMSVVSGMGKRALQFLLTQSNKRQSVKHESEHINNVARTGAPRKSPPQTSTKRKAVTKTTKPKSYKKRRSTAEGSSKDMSNVFAKDDDLSMATGAGKNALLSLLSMAEGNNNSELLDDEYVPSEDEGSVPSEDGQSEVQSLISGLHTVTSLALNDDASVVSGMGKKALRFLLTQSAKGSQEANKVAKKRAPRKSPYQSSLKRAKSASPKKRKANPARLAKTKAIEMSHKQYLGDSEDDSYFTAGAMGRTDDDMSVVSGMGKKALRFLLSQSANGNGNNNDSEDVMNLDLPQITKNNLVDDETTKDVKTKATKAKTTVNSTASKANTAKSKVLRKEDDLPARSGSTPRSKSTRLSHREDAGEEKDFGDGTSVNVNAATGMLSDEDFSVVTEGAGRNALASLLSTAKNADDATNLDPKSDPQQSSPQTSQKNNGINHRVHPADKEATETAKPKATKANPTANSTAAKIKVSPKEEDAPPLSFRRTTRSKSKSSLREDVGSVNFDDQTSLNVNFATGMSSDEEFSVATEGAGRNALAALLSSAHTAE